VTQSNRFKKQNILCVVFDDVLGLCLELGDKEIDNEIYGFSPTQKFRQAITEEVRFHIQNTGDIAKHATLRKVDARLQRARKRDNNYCQ
jgi:hypothetical protein